MIRLTAFKIDFKWHYIKDRLPDDLEYVLFECYDNTTKKSIFTAGYKDKDIFHDNCNEDAYFNEVPIENVRMWCYLRK